MVSYPTRDFRCVDPRRIRKLMFNLPLMANWPLGRLGSTHQANSLPVKCAHAHAARVLRSEGSISLQYY